MSLRRRYWLPVIALSPRERFVCEGIVEGLGYKEIAVLLDISLPTVKTTAQRAMDKLGVSDYRTLARLYSLLAAASKLSSRSRPVEVATTG